MQEIFKITKENQKSIKWLNFGKRKTKKIKKIIFNLENLEWLDLYHNQITALPKEISKLKNLRYLYLQNNPISGTEKENIKKYLPNCKILF